MIISIMQPGYLPWLGFFELLASSDIFIIYDDVDYDKGSWRNRNRIRIPNGSAWMTVPVLTKNRSGQKINDVRINNNAKWIDKHLKTIQQYYSGAPFFNKYIGVFEQIYSRQWDSLLDLNMTIIDYLAEILGIKTKIIYSSGLGTEGRKTDRIVEICKKLGATTYISSNGAKPYLQLDKFHNENINIKFQNYTHPVYPQVYDNFQSYMSVIDLMFNCGDDSFDIIMSGSTLS